MEPNWEDPRILSVGQYIEDDAGNIYLGGWLFAQNIATEDITIGDLERIAKEHKTYSLVPDIMRGQ